MAGVVDGDGVGVEGGGGGGVVDYKRGACDGKRVATAAKATTVVATTATRQPPACATFWRMPSRDGQQYAIDVVTCADNNNYCNNYSSFSCCSCSHHYRPESTC